MDLCIRFPNVVSCIQLTPTCSYTFLPTPPPIHIQRPASLFCYTCDNEHCNWNCLKTYRCEDHHKYCTTTYSSAGIGKDMGHRITKKCSADCPETNVNFGVAAYSTKCCSTSLCNFSGANSIKISYAVMLLGIVASLICVVKAGL